MQPADTSNAIKRTAARNPTRQTQICFDGKARESVLSLRHSTRISSAIYWPLNGVWPVKIFALVILSILAGVILLVGSSYLGIYARLFEASLSMRPMTTISVVAAVALLLWLGSRGVRPRV